VLINWKILRNLKTKETIAVPESDKVHHWEFGILECPSARNKALIFSKDDERKVVIFSKDGKYLSSIDCRLPKVRDCALLETTLFVFSEDANSILIHVWDDGV